MISVKEQTNILGAMPMSRLVIHMSWPIMLSMLTQAVYNLVDSVYITRVGDSAFLALSYAYPIQTLMAAFCVGVGVGFSAAFSRRLGEGKKEAASTAAIHGFLLYFACFLIFLAFGLWGCRAYLHTCTQTAQVVEQGVAYLQICCCLSFGMCLQFPCERVLQSTGHPAGFMIIQGSGALINILLDPIFIFVLDLGTRGAAIATVVGQISGGIIGLFLIRRIRSQFVLDFRAFRPSPALAGEMLRIAAPAVFIQSLSSFLSMGLNAIVRLWSETAVWVLGAYFKLQSFVYMPVFSVNNGLVSIISYNYGARDRRRVEGAVHFGLLTALGASLAGTVLLWLFAHPLLAICFSAGSDALAMGVPGLRMAALSFPPAAFSIIWSAAFQSLGCSRYSLLVCLLRNLLFPLPIAFLLIHLAPQWVFLCLLLTELAACLAALPLFLRLRRTRIQTI